MTKTVTIIPAHAGWYLFFPSMYEDGADFEPTDLEAVIAWRVESEKLDDGEYFETVTPIYVHGSNDAAWMVSPNGNVSDGHTYTWRSVNEALAHLRAEKKGGGS